MFNARKLIESVIIEGADKKKVLSILGDYKVRPDESKSGVISFYLPKGPGGDGLLADLDDEDITAEESGTVDGYYSVKVS